MSTGALLRPAASAPGAMHSPSRPKPLDIVFAPSDSDESEDERATDGAATAPKMQPAFAGLRIRTAGDDDAKGEGQGLRHRTVSITPSTCGDDEAEDTRLPWLGVKPEDMRMLEVIGRGASGQVRRVLHGPSGSVLAVKEIDIQDSERRKQMHKELNTLHGAGGHAELVQCFGVWYQEGAISIAMEFMDGGSLADLIELSGPLPEPALARVARSVLRALVLLRKLRLIHRDLKPHNILMNLRGEVKVSDFGCVGSVDAETGEDAGASTFVGTLPYMAPERIHGNRYSFASDVWSVGLSLLECARGYFPYAHCTGYFAVLSAVVHEPSPALPRDERHSAALCDFIDSCLQKDAAARPSAAELLEHPFLRLADAPDFQMSAFLQQAFGGEATPLPAPTLRPARLSRVREARPSFLTREAQDGMRAGMSARSVSRARVVPEHGTVDDEPAAAPARADARLVVETLDEADEGAHGDDDDGDDGGGARAGGARAAARSLDAQLGDSSLPSAAAATRRAPQPQPPSRRELALEREVAELKALVAAAEARARRLAVLGAAAADAPSARSSPAGLLQGVDGARSSSGAEGSRRSGSGAGRGSRAERLGRRSSLPSAPTPTIGDKATAPAAALPGAAAAARLARSSLARKGAGGLDVVSGSAGLGVATAIALSLAAAGMPLAGAGAGRSVASRRGSQDVSRRMSDASSETGRRSLAAPAQPAAGGARSQPPPAVTVVDAATLAQLHPADLDAVRATLVANLNAVNAAIKAKEKAKPSAGLVARASSARTSAFSRMASPWRQGSVPLSPWQRNLALDEQPAGAQSHRPSVGVYEADASQPGQPPAPSPMAAASRGLASRLWGGGGGGGGSGGSASTPTGRRVRAGSERKSAAPRLGGGAARARDEPPWTVRRTSSTAGGMLGSIRGAADGAGADASTPTPTPSAEAGRSRLLRWGSMQQPRVRSPAQTRLSATAPADGLAELRGDAARPHSRRGDRRGSGPHADNATASDEDEAVVTVKTSPAPPRRYATASFGFARRPQSVVVPAMTY